MLRAEEGELLPLPILAAYVYMGEEGLAEFRAACGNNRQIMFQTVGKCEPKETKAVKRACYRLWDDGLIQAYHDKDIPNTRLWGLPRPHPAAA